MIGPDAARTRRLADEAKQALTTLLEEGVLVRWPGGWWTSRDCPVDRIVRDWQGRDTPIPTWHVSVGAIARLLVRGYAEVTKMHLGLWHEVRPTKKARNLI